MIKETGTSGIALTGSIRGVCMREYWYDQYFGGYAVYYGCIKVWTCATEQQAIEFIKIAYSAA
jgi:hypothetical protein